MSVSEATICNRALTFLGANRISSLEDDSLEAKLCKEFYADIRDELLRSHPWKFALERTTLAVSSTTPEWGWDYKFPLPADCLRVVEMYGQEQDNWSEEGRFLMTDSSECKIKYIKKMTEVGRFDTSFTAVLALDIAIALTYALTTSEGTRDGLVKFRELKIKEARTYSAQSAVGDRVYADDWLNSRFT